MKIILSVVGIWFALGIVAYAFAVWFIRRYGNKEKA